MNNCWEKTGLLRKFQKDEGPQSCSNLAADVICDLLSPSVTSQRVCVESCVLYYKLSEQQSEPKIKRRPFLFSGRSLTGTNH